MYLNHIRLPNYERNSDGVCLMVQIRTSPRGDVGHQIQHTVSLHHTLTGQDGNVVPSFYSHRRIHFQMCVNHNHVAHLASSKAMHGIHLFKFAP